MTSIKFGLPMVVSVAAIAAVAAACTPVPPAEPTDLRAVVQGEVGLDPERAGMRVIPDWIVTVGDTGSGNGGGRYRVPGADLRFERLDDGLASSVRADGRGLFSTAIPTGNWRVRARYVADREYVGITAFALGPQGATIAVDLSASAMLLGKTIAPTPVSESIKVEILELGDYALSDTEGAWLFPALPAGTWTVRFMLEGFADAETVVTLAPGETRDLGTIMLGSAVAASSGVRAGFGSLLVVAGDESGRAVPEALCALEGLGIYGLAGADGVARLTATAGTYTVVCQKDGYATARRRGVKIAGNGELSSIAVELVARRSWGSLIVDVVDREARPISAAGIDLWTYERRAGALYTDERGRVRFETTDCVGLQAFHADFEPSIPFQACPNNLEGKDNYYLLTMCRGEECPPVWACLNGTRDCTPPETIISDAPPLAVTDTGGEADGVFVFAFGADEESTFLCKLDNGDWESCTSPYVIEDPAFGLHVLRVAAVDNENNVDRTPAVVAWSWQVGSEIWLHVDDCWTPNFPGCGLWDGLNGSGWKARTWIHAATDPDIAYKYPNGTTGAFHIRTERLEVGANLLEFNVGGLPLVGTITKQEGNTTNWLFGFDWLEDPLIDPPFGHPFHSHRSWIVVEYNDASTSFTALDCGWTSFALIDGSSPDSWSAHVGRGWGSIIKNYDGKLAISGAGNRAYYEPWFAKNASTWMGSECIEYDSFSSMATSPPVSPY